MSKEQELTRKHNPSWVYQLPSQLACFLLAICLVTSQINPCDATSVSMGSSLTFILLVMGIGILVAIDSVLSGIGFQPLVINSQAGSLCYFYRTLLVASTAVFGVWLWLCTTLVPGQGNARFAYNGCWQWIAEGILMLSIVRLSSRFRIAATLIALMLSTATGTVAYASYQYFISMPALRQRFASDPDSLFAEMGAVAGSSEAMQLSNRLASLEPTGPFALTNSLAGLMATWLVFLVVLLGSQAAAHSLHSGVAKMKWTVLTANWISLILGIGLIGSFFVTLLLTKSRSAWLATILCLLASGFVHPTLRQSGWAFAKRFRHWMAAVATLCVLSIGGILLRDQTIIAEAGKSLSYRFDYWRGAIELIRAEPWTGYGVANFQQNYNRVKVITASESPADPHNFIFETAAAGGLPLLAILIAILTISFSKMFELSFSQLKDGESPFVRKANSINAVVLGGLIGCVGVLLVGLFNSDVDVDMLISSTLFVGVAILVFVLIERLHWLADDHQIGVVSLLSASAMIVHLLASGGWMQSGLMNSVCVLVGIAFPTYSIHFETSGKAIGSRFQLSCVAGLLLMTIAAADFARTMCIPVLGSAAVVSAVSSDPTAVHEPSQWREIVKIDPFDVDLPSLAANRCVEVLQRNDLSSTTRQKYLDVFDGSCKEYVKRDPNQWTSYAECGKWNAILAESGNREGESAVVSRKELANDFFAKAAKIYPSSAQIQLQAAVGAVWCGKLTDAKRFMSQAVNIDQQTKHTDRKLAAAVVYFPKQLEIDYAPLEKLAKIENQPGFAKGEPILRWLRTNVP